MKFNKKHVIVAGEGYYCFKCHKTFDDLLNISEDCKGPPIVYDWDARQVACNGVLEDCKRIQKVLARHYIITLPEAQKIWQRYSDSVDAAWMCLPAMDENLYKILMDNIYE